MTIGQFSQRQLDYIAEERKRMNDLQMAWWAYKAAARKLGLHALTQREIDDRRDELDRMEREALTPEYNARQAAFAKMMGSP